MSVARDTAYPSVTPDEAAEAIHYFLEHDTKAIHDALRMYGVRISASDEKRRDRKVSRLRALPSEFFAVDAINRESSSYTFHDRDEAYEHAGYAVSVNFSDRDRRADQREANRFCDKHYRRIGQRQAFSECAYRHLVTRVRFQRDKERCSRDIAYMIAGDTSADVKREEYRCMRKAGWRDITSFIANIDLPRAE